MSFKIGRGGSQEKIYRPASQGNCQCLAINIFRRDKSSPSLAEGFAHTAPEAEKWSQKGSVGKAAQPRSHYVPWEIEGGEGVKAAVWKYGVL